MDTKHTPGPWHWVNPETDVPAMPSENSGYGSLRTVEEFGENKREERDGKFYTSFRLPKFILSTEDISDEDARLIAAAPELLEALRQAMGWIDSWHPNFTYDPDWPEVAHHIKAAIAKATQP